MFADFDCDPRQSKDESACEIKSTAASHLRVSFKIDVIARGDG
jgi:hypothetical protein